ncbi:hypothetical protein [Falsibacillus pallidus]|uniref:hypothetical protein n=1 Tax=Falsibacillus pallidus TaxID=493781 RepID=UPI003D990AEE
MKEYQKIISKKEILKSVKCNKCGKTELFNGPEDKNLLKLNDFHTFDIKFGYGSKYDEQRWMFDLCESCLIEFIGSFKCSPEKTTY